MELEQPSDNSGQSSEGRLHRVLSAACSSLVVVFLILGLLLLFALSWNRAFQVDEVENIHAAFNIREGRLLYVDFFQVHNPLLYVLLAPAIDTDDPVFSFHAARTVSALLLLGTISLCAVCGWRVAGRIGAVLAAGLALLHTTLIERGMEVRPDGPMALCTMAALAVELHPDWSRRRRAVGSALLLGLGFLLTQKAIFPSIAFGCLWLFDAVRRRQPSLVVMPTVIWFLPLTIALVVMTLLGNASAYIEQNFVHSLEAAAGAEHRATFGPMGFILHESRRNVLFVALALAGLIAGWWSTLFGETRRDGLGALTFIGTFLLASLWLNPFPWPYVHVGVLPVLAVLAAFVPAVIIEKWYTEGRRWRKSAISALILCLAATTSLPRLVYKAVPDTEYQFDLLREIDRVTDPEDSVFDLVGLYFRPDAYPGFAMSGDLFRWYTLGGFPPIITELVRREAVAVIFSYRITWLQPKERQFVNKHFVHYWGNLLLLGRDLSRQMPDTPVTFEVLKTKEFRYEGPGTLRVDGVSFREGILEKGSHVLSLDSISEHARLIMATPPPLPEPTPPKTLYINFD